MFLLDLVSGAVTLCYAVIRACAIMEDHSKYLVGPAVHTNTYIFPYFY